MTRKIILIAAVAVFFSMITPASAEIFVTQNICEDEVLNAQKSWCEALVSISTTYAEKGHAEAKALARQVIEVAYGYQLGTVLFKPTLATNPHTFRTTAAGALSYFVGGDSNFPDDSGFALKDWILCEPENAAIFITGNTASTMGKVHFTDKNSNLTTVDKTWVFIKDDSRNLRIVVHHSSLEYQGP